MVKYCSDCGIEIMDTDNFCKGCGRNLVGDIKESKISILIIITIILTSFNGLIGILLGLFGLGIGLFSPKSFFQTWIDYKYMEIGSLMFIGFGLFILIFGILNVIGSYGLWNLKKWAGILVIILNLVIIFFAFLLGVWLLIILIILPVIFIILRWNKLK